MSSQKPAPDPIMTPLGELVTTADGSATLRHPGIDEEYHSKDGARFETDQLYMRRSGFLGHLTSHDATAVGVLDVGLGLGFNALTTIAAWTAAPSPGDLFLLSLEINPDLVRELATGVPIWGTEWGDDWRALARQLVPVGDSGLWRATFTHSCSARTLSWVVWVGNAAEGSWEQACGVPLRFVWQDAFSPRKNPELWTAAWFARIKSQSARDVALMTYSVSRPVKDGLKDGGWLYALIPAEGTKRHWLTAALTPERLASLINTI